MSDWADHIAPTTYSKVTITIESEGVSETITVPRAVDVSVACDEQGMETIKTGGGVRRTLITGDYGLSLRLLALPESPGTPPVTVSREGAPV